MARTTVEGRLNTLRREVAASLRAAPPSRRPRKSVPRWKTVAVSVAKVAFAAVLPFVLYVRTSLAFHQSAGLSPRLAVLFGALVTLACAALYGAWLSRRIGDASIGRMLTRFVLLPTALAWCVYSALYLSRVNAKTDAVRAQYGALHPVLRVAVATAILGDPDLVITDGARVPEDYRRMGLPVNDRTRHYRQTDGWVHAIDLRTNGRGEARNRALQLYFRAMGFRTLRHVGTADHLHVQLSAR